MFSLPLLCVGILWLVVMRIAQHNTARLILRFQAGDWLTATRLPFMIFGNDPALLYYLGISRLYGLGGAPYCHERAMKYLNSAMRRGNPDAIAVLAWLYRISGQHVSAKMLSLQAHQAGSTFLGDILARSGDEGEAELLDKVKSHIVKHPLIETVALPRFILSEMFSVWTCESVLCSSALFVLLGLVAMIWNFGVGLLFLVPGFCLSIRWFLRRH